MDHRIEAFARVGIFKPENRVMLVKDMPYRRGGKAFVKSAENRRRDVIDRARENFRVLTLVGSRYRYRGNLGLRNVVFIVIEHVNKSEDRKNQNEELYRRQRRLPRLLEPDPG